MKRTRGSEDASIEQRVRELINPAFDEWIERKIDAAELERRRVVAHKRATAEHSLHVDSETGAKPTAEARCATTAPRRRMSVCTNAPAPFTSAHTLAHSPTHVSISLHRRSVPKVRVSSRSPQRARATWRATRYRRRTSWLRTGFALGDRD